MIMIMARVTAALCLSIFLIAFNSCIDVHGAAAINGITHANFKNGQYRVVAASGATCSKGGLYFRRECDRKGNGSLYLGKKPDEIFGWWSFSLGKGKKKSSIIADLNAGATGCVSSTVLSYNDKSCDVTLTGGQGDKNFSVQPVEGTTDRFTIEYQDASSKCKKKAFLGVPKACEGQNLQLYDKDNGSGLQHWILIAKNPPKPGPKPKPKPKPKPSPNPPPLPATPFTVVFDLSKGSGLTVVLPLAGTVNVQIDWGDGSALETVKTAGWKSHTYASGSTGRKTVKLTGSMTAFGNSTQDPNYVKLVEVTSFGDFPITSLEYAFHAASNLVKVPSSIPRGVTNLSFTFVFAGLFNQDISGWDVSKVTDTSWMFLLAAAFNQDVSGWDVSSVTTMREMFYGASAFNNAGKPLSWGSKTAKVTNMAVMFYGAAAFNQDVSGWDVSSVTTMGSMFASFRPSAFNNGGKPLSWGSKTSKVTDMSQMFAGASSFNQDISGWNVSSVTNMSNMFAGATSFNQPLNAWGTKTSKVTNMAVMFSGAAAFNQPLNSWNVSNVTNMSFMFRDATLFNQNISGWNVSSVTNMSVMFAGATSFNQPLNAWGTKTSKVTNMSSMFSGAAAFNQPLDSWNVSNVTNMSFMFSGAAAFNQNISGWDVNSVTNCGGFLASGSKLLCTYLPNGLNQSCKSFCVVVPG